MRDKTNTSVEGPALASHSAHMEGSSDKLFCCRWVCHRVPLAHREELYHILRMTGPLVRIRAVAVCGLRLSFIISGFIQWEIDKSVLFKMSGNIGSVSEFYKQLSVNPKQCLPDFKQ